jgi:hypothetical protein
MIDKDEYPRTAFQIVHDELTLDGNARLNLLTFRHHVGPSSHGRSRCPPSTRS